MVCLPKYRGCPAADFQADLATPTPPAFVVAAPSAASKLKSGGAQAEQKLVDELKKYVADNKIRYKALAEVQFLEAIPKTPSGELLRKDCTSSIALAPSSKLRRLTICRADFFSAGDAREAGQAAQREALDSIRRQGVYWNVRIELLSRMYGNGRMRFRCTAVTRGDASSSL